MSEGMSLRGLPSRNANDSVSVNSFDNEIPLTVPEWFCRICSGTTRNVFEDGTPLPPPMTETTVTKRVSDH